MLGDSPLESWASPPMLMCVCVRGGCEGGGEPGSELPPPLDLGTPAFAGFLHSGPSKGPDCREDLETTYLEQVIAQPVFISLRVCF